MPGESHSRRMVTLIEEALTRSIIGAFYEVYNCLGYGYLEHLYVLALERELVARGHTVSRQVGVTVFYKGQPLGQQRLDMIVDGKCVIEVKSTFQLHPAHERQLRSYLQGTGLQVGLLLHFGPDAKFVRIVNTGKDQRRSANPDATQNVGSADHAD
jgi:GxxExxY protein